MFGPIFHPGPLSMPKFRDDVRFLIEQYDTQVFTLSRDYGIYKNVLRINT